MLYQWYEAQRRMLEPLSQWSDSAAAAMGAPAALWTDMVPAYANLQRTAFAGWSVLGVPTPDDWMKQISAGLDLFSRVTKTYDRPTFAIKQVTIKGEPVAVSEAVALKLPFCNLLHFAKATKKKSTEPAVVIFAPLSGHYATLLRDTAKSMLQDHEVYITDWQNARDIPLANGAFSFDDYVTYVQNFLQFVAQQHGEVHAVSVCQPTVPVLAGVSLLAQSNVKHADGLPKSLTLMGGPIDTRRNPTQVNSFAAKHSPMWFESNVIHRVPANYQGYMRRVYPGFLQLAGFMALNPDRHMQSHKDYFKHLVQGDGDSAEAHRKFYDEYNAVMDLPAEYYLDTIARVFHEFRLPRGVLEVGGALVEPSAIESTALLTIEGELDDISGSGQTEAAQGLCSGIKAAHKKHHEAPGVGHYGIFSGRKWREQIYPVVKDFIAKH
jgi:poly(3-hydroxybutyrate) depolymerase